MTVPPAIRFRRWLRRALILSLLSLLLFLSIALHYAWRAQRFNLDELALMPQRAEVRDRDGELIGRLAGENRDEIKFNQISPKLVRAILAREDSRFETHAGVDWLGMARSMLRNLREREMIQGGSTLTMQLARNTWPLSQGGGRRAELDRKLLELALALRIEAHLDKPTLFQHYANRIYLGDGCYGVEAAARNYFGHSAAELNWTEAAALAGLIRAPSELNPRTNPQANAAERRQVIRRLLDEGWIEPAQAQAARERPLELAPRPANTAVGNPWLLEQVRRELEALFPNERERQAIARVETTYDLDLQRQVEQALSEHLRQIERSDAFRVAHPNRPRLQGAVALIGSQRGELRALVGGRDPRNPGFHRAVQMRRPLGSTIKPIVYAAAFSAGLSPEETISDAPLAEDREQSNPGLSWDPENADGSNLGQIRARDGLILSRNTVTVRVGRRAGKAAIAQLAQQLGLDPLPDSETAWLGTSEGSPLQLASAYTVFANHGQHRPAWSLTEVRDRSARLLFRAAEGSQTILSPAVARTMDECLHDITQRGTARWLAGQDFHQRAAGKTGTSNNFHDAWFVGYTAEACASVWIGFDQPAMITPNGYGSVLALPLWAQVMRLGM